RTPPPARSTPCRISLSARLCCPGECQGIAPRGTVIFLKSKTSGDTPPPLFRWMAPSESPAGLRREKAGRDGALNKQGKKPALLRFRGALLCPPTVRTAARLDLGDKRPKRCHRDVEPAIRGLALEPVLVDGVREVSTNDRVLRGALLSRQ